MSSPAEKTVTADSSSAVDVDACFGHLVNVLNSGMLALMISVGDRTGLFNTMQSMPASTSAQIAATAGLDERYVREWLAAMTAGGIVAHDPVRMTFELPPAYAEALARGLGGDSSMAGMCQHVALLGKVEDRIVDHFRRGGGVPYETYEELWAGDEPMTWTPLTPWRLITFCRCFPGSPSDSAKVSTSPTSAVGRGPSSICSQDSSRPADSWASSCMRRRRSAPRGSWQTVTD